MILFLNFDTFIAVGQNILPHSFCIILEKGIVACKNFFTVYCHIVKRGIIAIVTLTFKTLYCKMSIEKQAMRGVGREWSFGLPS